MAMHESLKLCVDTIGSTPAEASSLQ